MLIFDVNFPAGTSQPVNFEHVKGGWASSKSYYNLSVKGKKIAIKFIYFTDAMEIISF